MVSSMGQTARWPLEVPGWRRVWQRCRLEAQRPSPSRWLALTAGAVPARPAGRVALQYGNWRGTAADAGALVASAKAACAPLGPLSVVPSATPWAPAPLPHPLLPPERRLRCACFPAQVRLSAAAAATDSPPATYAGQGDHATEASCRAVHAAAGGV